jgi:hypothetical protein
MIRLLNAFAELIEAKAELIREEAATTGLRTYSRAYKEGQDDLLEGAVVVYTTESTEDE